MQTHVSDKRPRDDLCTLERMPCLTKSRDLIMTREVLPWNLVKLSVLRWLQPNIFYLFISCLVHTSRVVSLRSFTIHLSSTESLHSLICSFVAHIIRPFSFLRNSYSFTYISVKTLYQFMVLLFHSYPNVEPKTMERVNETNVAIKSRMKSVILLMS